MNELTIPEAMKAETLERAIGKGDLSELTPQQRVEYVVQTCKLIGLNPLTRPFRFLNFQGQTSMYATKDCADQLRASRKVSLIIADKSIDAGVFAVTVRASTPDGRHDEDMGAVPIGNLQGEARANAIMKAITKAKRRATLSLCGLGFLDESELETMPGVQTFDADAPVVPMPQQQQQTKRLTVREWLDEFETDCAAATTEERANEILKQERVLRASEFLSPAQLGRLETIKAAMLARLCRPLPDNDQADEQTAA
jgi:hypothetical protein